MNINEALLLLGEDAWSDPPTTCEVYEGQKGGAFNNESPSPNSSGRTDVEGCCWWGRYESITEFVCHFDCGLNMPKL